LIACSTIPSPEKSAPAFYDVPVPASLSLCGEPVPLKDPAVREMLDRELTISVWDQAQVFLWLKRAGRYFPYIEKKLAQEGMPDDLKYLPVAESSLLTYSESNKGAVGPWQLIGETGERNGLRRDPLVDERHNFERAASASLKYLKKLKEMFGSWSLALAAYNCGEARVKKEMGIQQVNDYYRLNLPLETERFIFRIAAIKLVMENPKSYGYHLPSDHLYKPVACDTAEITLDMPVHIADVARALETDFKIIKELNPQLTDYCLPAGSYEIKVPSGQGEKLSGILAQLAATSPCSTDKEQYTVQEGDTTLAQVAQKTGVSLEVLKKINGISDPKIKPGQKLRLKP
ncbi:MAG: transglycosylase SLT domain-containing protein, partial [Pseudomonadota bacterium]